jgi:membrane protein implicated in regulation of membrane protease activity
MTENRLPVPDPGLMRHAFRRMVVALVLLLILTAFFTAGGIAVVVSGELPGLPLAVGGAVLMLSAVVLVVAVFRVRRTLDGRTISRSALLAARRTAALIRRTAVLTVLVLLLFGLVRLAFDDRWSLATAALMSVGLWLLARGSKNLGKAQDQTLAQPA